jgi:propionyl-CoA carboxylase alpha chain
LPALEPAVRWDSGVEVGSEVGVSFDPMLAKVIAHGSTRAEAAARLALALERFHVGGVRTNRDFLAAVLRHEAFIAGDTTTDFIERHAPAFDVVLAEGELDEALATAALWWLFDQHRSSSIAVRWPVAWRECPPAR